MKHYGTVGTGEYYTRVYVYKHNDGAAMMTTEKPRFGWAPEGCVDALHTGGLGTNLPELEAAEDFLLENDILERCKCVDGGWRLWFKDLEGK